MMDSVFLTHSTLGNDGPVSFGSFKCGLSRASPQQPNDYDCGVFVIRNMQFYGKDWASDVGFLITNANFFPKCFTL
jgi:hypothetical protein